MKKFLLEQDMPLEAEKIAAHIVSLEREALDKWFQGDTSGYAKLWSQRSFSYFDAVVNKRVDSHETIMDFLKTIEGKLFAESYEFCEPRVQLGTDTAVLTYQLFANTTLMDMAYNCIEIFQREADGAWHVIHSTWSCIRPMDVKSWPQSTVV